MPTLLVVLLLLQVPLALLAHAARGVQAVAGAPAPPPTWGWGYNEYGQVGDGEIAIKTPLPRRVVALDGVITIAGGGAHSLALRADGTVWNWGSTDHGRIGNGQTKPDSQTTPIQVPGLNAVTAIADGGGHSLVLRSDGTVWGWGSDLDGELGPASTTLDNPTPLRVQGIDQVRAIGAGSRYSLAVRSDGTVWAWGSNEYGQLGVPTGNQINRAAPGQVPGPVGIMAVAAGGYESLALGSDGTVWSWGGANTTTFNASPGQRVVGLGGITAIAVAYPGLLALKSDGTVWSWRGGVAPAPLAGLTDVRALAGQGRHSLFLRGDGTILALGNDNSSGQLGDGTYEANPDIPVLVRGIGAATAIGVGGGHSLAVAAPPPPLAPARLRFASQPVSTGGPTLSADVTNGESGPLAVGGVTTTGDFAPVNDCPASLAPSATCTVRVGFRPTATGTRSGTLTVAVGGTNHSLALEGVGTPAPTTPVSVAPWYGAAPLGSPREGHTATLLQGGRVLVAGGAIYDAATGRYAPLSSAELYDPATGRWSATGSMRAARQRHTATLLPDGRVLVVGGSSGGTLYAGLLQSAEIYDPSTGRWIPAKSTLGYNGVTRHTATLLSDGRVLVSGGNTDAGTTVRAIIYTPPTDTWNYAPRDMHYVRYDHTATLLPDGTVLVVGGDSGVGTGDRYDPASGSWSEVVNTTSRAGHTATLLPGGVVLLAGGTRRAGNPVPPDSSLYPSRTTAAMNAARQYHTATLLPDGDRAGGRRAGCGPDSASLDRNLRSCRRYLADHGRDGDGARLPDGDAAARWSCPRHRRARRCWHHRRGGVVWYRRGIGRLRHSHRHTGCHGHIDPYTVCYAECHSYPDRHTHFDRACRTNRDCDAEYDAICHVDRRGDRDSLADAERRPDQRAACSPHACAEPQSRCCTGRAGDRRCTGRHGDDGTCGTVCVRSARHPHRTPRCRSAIPRLADRRRAGRAGARHIPSDQLD